MTTEPTRLAPEALGDMHRVHAGCSGAPGDDRNLALIHADLHKLLRHVAALEAEMRTLTNRSRTLEALADGFQERVLELEAERDDYHRQAGVLADQRRREEHRANTLSADLAARDATITALKATIRRDALKPASWQPMNVLEWHCRYCFGRWGDGEPERHLDTLNGGPCIAAPEGG